MAINADYPTPVVVNGFACKNCTDVDYAKKHIDPAHPKDGPYRVDASADASKTGKRTSAFNLSGALAGRDVASGAATPKAVGGRLDVSA